MLTITLSGEIPDEYTVDIVGSNGETLTMTCADPQQGHKNDPQCLGDGKLQLGGIAPKELTVTVRWEDGNVTQTFTPDYEVYYYNGRNCPPTCYSAELTMSLS